MSNNFVVKVFVTAPPCAGKSAVAQAIQEALERLGAVVTNDETDTPTRDAGRLAEILANRSVVIEQVCTSRSAMAKWPRADSQKES